MSATPSQPEQDHNGSPTGLRSGAQYLAQIRDDGRQVIYDGEVSLWPSVAATGLPCNSHYFVTRGEVDWRRKLDVGQSAEARAADRRAIKEHRAVVPNGWLERLKRYLGKQGV